MFYAGTIVLELLTPFFAHSLEKLLPDLLNLDQAGFIHHTPTTGYTRKTRHIIGQMQKEEFPAIICGLDKEKAFVSVRCISFYKMLGKFGFQGKKAFCDRPVNADLCRIFSLNCGYKWGCSISPLLFDLLIEALGESIRKNEMIRVIVMSGVEQKVPMFADDVI